MSEIQKYVVTGSNYPDWLNGGAAIGLIKTVMDDEGKFSHIIVEAATGRKFAYKNDVIVKTKSGFSVLTGEQAEKYRVTFVPKKKENPKKVEENDNEVDE